MSVQASALPNIDLQMCGILHEISQGQGSPWAVSQSLDVAIGDLSIGW
jgi:hypothetical protein